MNSFIKVPHNRDIDYINYVAKDFSTISGVNVTIQLLGNTFSQINSCGSIFSNNFFVISSPVSFRKGHTFAYMLSKSYNHFLNTASIDYESRKFK